MRHSSLKCNLLNYAETTTNSEQKSILERRNQRNRIIDENREMAQPPTIMEQCLAALTDIVNRQTQQPPLRSRIEKEIRYLPAFDGQPGRLPSFITSVDRTIAEYGQQAQEVYTVIYNEKILGEAKNYLDTSPPETWDACKAKLKLQYKPAKDQGQIMREINFMKVSTIIELMDKISITVKDIAECAIFSDYQAQIVNNLSSVLVQKIKELTAGALAAELYNKFSLEDIRPTINKYVGQDCYNLKMCKSNFSKSDNYNQKQNFTKQAQNGRQYNNNNSNNFRNNSNNSLGQFQNNSNNSGQFRNNNYNSSGQYRGPNQNNSWQFRRNFNNNSAQFRNMPQGRNNDNNNQPMEVDTLSVNQEVNQLSEPEFFIN